MADDTSLELLKASRAVLLQGLTEENHGLQLLVQSFWSQEKRLPVGTLERLLAVLRSLYSSDIEQSFLGLATNLLLERSSHSPDFTRSLFEFPLSECTFQDYVVDSSWRVRSSVMTPMFVETQASQDPASQPAAPARGQLRATVASLEFSQTQAPGRRSAYNWLTGSSVDTLAESLGPESSSSLLVFGRREGPGPRKPLNQDFGTRRLPAMADELDSRTKAANERRADILRLRRRFLKDQEKVSMTYARKEIHQQRQKKELQVELQQRRDAQVTLYRTYRTGDLPDVQIPHSSLIAPLQALAQRDAGLAKLLFSALFSGVLGGCHGNRSRTLEQLRPVLESLLSHSSACFPPFVACVQDMCYQHEELLLLQPAAISSSCLASLQQPCGVLLLEEALLQACPHQEPPSKRQRGRRDVPPDVERWIHLAKLYRSLDEYDVVRGIFGGKIGTKSISGTALQAEANSDFAEAVKLYNEALNSEHWPDGEPTDSEKDFWEMAALDAYSHLTEWKSLQYCATVNIDDNSPPDLDKMWSEPIYQEMYLPHMLRSMLKRLQMGEHSQDLLSFVDRAMQIEERRKVLEWRYSQELSLLYILQEDYDRAKYYANYAMELFIQTYASVDSLLNRSRLTILQSVQALTEIHEFLQFIRGEVSVKSLKRLTRKWAGRYPDAKMDPLNVWDDIVTSRCFFLDKICGRLRGQATGDSMEMDGSEPEPGSNLDTLVTDCKFSMKLRMADSAVQQSNFPVATKLLKELHGEAREQRHLLPRWVLSFSRFSHKRSVSQGPAEQVGAMLKTIPLLDDLQADCPESRRKTVRQQQVLLGSSYQVLATALASSPSVLETISSQKAEQICSIAGVSSSASPEEVALQVQVRALGLFRGAVRLAEEEVQSYGQEWVEVQSIIDTHMALANFCDKLLREEEQSSSISTFPELPVLPAHVVQSLLTALKMDSEEARLRFPRLLQLIELYPSETMDLMIKEMMAVPCWMLIGWLSQMVALLDKPEAVAVQHSIGQIAESYPQALVYPLMISCEGYSFQDSAAGHQQRQFVDRLKLLLDKGGTFRRFVDALQQLTNPEMLFKDWWDDFKNLVEKPGFDRKQMEALHGELQTILGDHKAFGVFRKRFIQKFGSQVEKLAGPRGSRLFENRKEASYLKQVDELLQEMRGFQKEPGNLKEYSPWLSTFRADILANEMEVPGQYGGRCKPLPEYHAKITGFDERVKVMNSIRRPKRLVVRGDDECDHPFLLKGGEDLRQDQRVQQLLGVMNGILGHTAATAHRALQLHTYQVIPFTTRIGMIEWMENTCTLKDLLDGARTQQEQKNSLRPQQEYDCWLTKASSKKEGIPRYAEVYRRAKRAETVANFLKVCQLVPGDLLRRALLRMSSSPESFLSLRSHLLSSHALLSLSHWLLGIGDRHLSNFMVHSDTGGMVGIDFGHAFGSATQFLAVPELMPFRMTRQLVTLAQPLTERGLVRSVMVHALRAFCTQPDLLLNTMDVFVKEPSLDWKNFELKQLKKGGSWTKGVNVKEVNWFPLQKVGFARRKLQGANPAAITSEELQLGFEKSAAFQGMQAVALGDAEHNVRARLPAGGLSVEQQVDCLLDQAMDANILGRTWQGWEPWV